MNLRLFGAACAAALFVVACGSSNNGSSSGSTGGGSSSGSTGGSSTGSTGTTGTGSTSGSASTGGSSSGSTGLSAINACDPSTAVDLTGSSTTAVTISGLAYSPACIKVRAGTVVTISASSVHPLHPGVDCVDAASGASPIAISTADEPVTFANPGSYGFFCSVHCSSAGMKGAVYVVP